MSSERSIETTGETVEEAISRGLAELGGVAPTDVIVEVLEEPRGGMFGLGARPARVRLQLFRAPSPEKAAPKPAVDESFVSEEEEGAALVSELHEVTDDADMDEDVRVSKVVLSELLEKMDILRFQITIRRAVEASESNPWLLDISGPTANNLIGRRGETLNALQYITRLISSRELQHRANIVVDVDGYKARRSRMLHDLAIRMADQAVRSQRTVALEPMPSYERRIIHMALRSRSDVQTRSVGEGNARKVTIVPRQS